MANKKLERFGRYVILDHIQDGGMAIISRALFIGEQSSKLVVIKQMREAISDDEEFVTMFMDEIKIAFDLSHPNIAQTFDYGKLNNRLFLAMEYIDGRSVRDLLDQLQFVLEKLSISHVVYLISQVCQGLHYAHAFKNKFTGESANIIHRDISPENIMISYDGIVKVIDFGIAKADTNSRRTQAGAIKGKFSYFAPEYIMGLPIDSRYDVFSLGLVLWEILCMRPHFEKDDDNPFAVLSKIEKCEIILPSIFIPTLPLELERIIVKALQKNPNKRYQSMEDFGQELTTFLHNFDANFSVASFRERMRKIFAKDIEKDEAILKGYVDVNVEEYYQDYKRETAQSKGDKDIGIKNVSPALPEKAMPKKKLINTEIYKEIIRKTAKALTGESTVVAKSRKSKNKEADVDLTKFDRPRRREMVVNSDPSDEDDSSINLRRVKFFTKLFAVLFLILWIGNMITPFAGIYARQMGHKGFVSWPIQNSKGVQIFYNEELIASGLKKIEVPVYERVYFRFIKDGVDPYIVPVMLEHKDQMLEIPAPKFTKSSSGIIECEDKDFPAKSVLRIQMAESDKLYIVKLPFNKLSLPEGDYVALFNDQKIDFKVSKDILHKVKILKSGQTKENRQ